MTQNIYDNAKFLAGYSQLPRSTLGLDGAPEWATLRSMLPSVADKRVLDLGCGFGWFCRWAADQGASSVLGIDVSENMLSRATADTSSTKIAYQRQDLEELPSSIGSFDLVYSSLTLHYIEDLPKLLKTVHQILHPGGAFVFSVEHPIFSAPANPGFTGDPANRTWPLSNYLRGGERTTYWFADGVIKYHRTVGAYVNNLISSDLRIDRLEEWGPTEKQLTQHPEWKDEVHRPPFLLIRSTKNSHP